MSAFDIFVAVAFLITAVLTCISLSRTYWFKCKFNSWNGMCGTDSTLEDKDTDKEEMKTVNWDSGRPEMDFLPRENVLEYKLLLNVYTTDKLLSVSTGVSNSVFKHPFFKKYVVGISKPEDNYDFIADLKTGKTEEDVISFHIMNFISKYLANDVLSVAFTQSQGEMKEGLPAKLYLSNIQISKSNVVEKRIDDLEIISLYNDSYVHTGCSLETGKELMFLHALFSIQHNQIPFVTNDSWNRLIDNVAKYTHTSISEWLHEMTKLTNMSESSRRKLYKPLASTINSKKYDDHVNVRVVIDLFKVRDQLLYSMKKFMKSDMTTGLDNIYRTIQESLLDNIESVEFNSTIGVEDGKLSAGVIAETM